MLNICKDWLCVPISSYSKMVLSAEFSELCKEAELLGGKLFEFSKITHFSKVKERNLCDYLHFLEQLNKNCSQLLAGLKAIKNADVITRLKIAALELEISGFVIKLSRAQMLALSSPFLLFKLRSK